MHSQMNGSVSHILAIGFIVAALCVFMASCIRFFFRDVPWKTAKVRNEQMDLESQRSSSWKNNNATLGCIGILGSLLLLAVGIALIGNDLPHSPESAQAIVNGTKMYPDVPSKHHSNVNNHGIIEGSKLPLPPKKKK